MASSPVSKEFVPSLGVHHTNFRPTSVQFKSKINSDEAGKRHQTRHLEFHTPQLLTKGLQIPRSIGVGSTFLHSLVGRIAEVHPPVLLL